MKNVDFNPKLKIHYTEVSDGNIDEKFGTKADVKENRKKVLKELKLKTYELIEGQQIHFTRVLALNEDNAKMWRGYNITGVDGFTTDQTDIALMLRVADCVPLVLYDPVNHAMAVLHVGWKGATLGMEKVGVEKMIEVYETVPRDLKAWIGPSAQSCCYTSAKEPEQAEDKAWKKCIKKKKGEWQVDIPDYLVSSLKKMGVLKKNMVVSDICTVEDQDLFSHQRAKKENQPEGRFGVVVQLDKKK